MSSMTNSETLLHFMKKLSLGVQSCSDNFIVVKAGNTAARDQWAEIAAAWRAAGKPSPSDYEPAGHSGAVNLRDVDVFRCLRLAKS
jgi:hypothetical protein